MLGFFVFIVLFGIFSQFHIKWGRTPLQKVYVPI